jgi:manganese/zinc/iron transport system permease protein
MDILRELIFDYTMRNVALGAAILGMVSGALGTFAVLRKQSLLGDTISHSALPGIGLAFLFAYKFMPGMQKAPLVLMTGAAIAGWLGTYLVLSIIHHTRIKEDSSLGIILSVFFGFGLVLLSYIQRMSTSTKAGLDKFLFGQAATLMAEDVAAMAILGGIALFLLLLFWKEFKLMTFNHEFGEAQGLPRKKLDILLVSLLVIAIVIGLQTVGVVLMSALVVIPPAAARQWSKRLGPMVILSGLFGATAGVFGAVISGRMERLPTGPTIVLTMAAIMIISMLFAPGRGILWELQRRLRNRQRFRLEGILMDLYILAQQHDDYRHCHSVGVLQTMRPNKEGVARGLEVLREKGWAEKAGDDQWRLTQAGYNHAKSIEEHGEDQ